MKSSQSLIESRPLVLHQVSYSLTAGWIDHTRTQLRKLKTKNNSADLWVCWCYRIIPFSTRIFGPMLPVTLTHSLQNLRATMLYNTDEKECRSKMPFNGVKEVISDVSVLTSESKFACFASRNHHNTKAAQERRELLLDERLVRWKQKSRRGNQGHDSFGKSTSTD
jgi:hypothetical protein